MGALLDQKQQEAHEEGRASASSKKARELVAEEAVEDAPAAHALGAARMPMMAEAVDHASYLASVVSTIVSEHAEDQVRARRDQIGHRRRPSGEADELRRNHVEFGR